jgi:hypothetical protein
MCLNEWLKIDECGLSVNVANVFSIPFFFAVHFNENAQCIPKI